MSDRFPRAPSRKTELFPIRTVADLTGVKAVTLRAWEHRYGLLDPLRNESGHRLYGREQIDRVNRILGLLGKGMSISQVAQTLALSAGRGPAERASPWRDYQHRVVAAVARFDNEGLEEAYSAALALHPIETVTRHLLLPVLDELGRRWQTGEGSVAEEHFFSIYVRDKLGARFHHRTRANTGPRVLAACLPDEQHEIGLLIFTLAALDRGMRVVLLAARTPLEELATAARRAGCAAVALSATMTPPESVVGKQLPEVVAAAGVPVFVGGVASLHGCDAFVATGAHVLGTDISTGVERIQTVLACARVV